MICRFDVSIRRLHAAEKTDAGDRWWRGDLVVGESLLANDVITEIKNVDISLLVDKVSVIIS